MKRIITLLLLFVWLNATACDICSSSVINTNGNQMWSFNRSSIGAVWSRTRISNEQNQHYLLNAYSIDARYVMKKKWQIGLVLPWQSLNSSFDTQVNTMGIGDVSIYSRYNSIRKESGKKLKHSLSHKLGGTIPFGQSFPV